MKMKFSTHTVESFTTKMDTTVAQEKDLLHGTDPNQMTDEDNADNPPQVVGEVLKRKIETRDIITREETERMIEVEEVITREETEILDKDMKM